MTLILGLEMAGRSKNATPKFFPRVFLELLYKEIWGGGSKADEIFLKSVQIDERSRKKLKKWGVIFLPMKHKSGHKFSTKDFCNKLTSDLNSPIHLASKNKVVSLNKFVHTPWRNEWESENSRRFSEFGHISIFPCCSQVQRTERGKAAGLGARW